MFSVIMHMHNSSSYLCHAVFVIGGLLLFQLLFAIDFSFFWRLFFSNESTVNEHQSESFESSVWCHHDSDKHRLCTFRNMCFSSFHKQFIFVLSSNSTLWGVDDKRDLSTLDLSSVSSHNKFMLKIVMVSSNDIILKRKVVSKEPVYLMSRFKADNIMHVVHDDLLPLFTSYMKVCAGNVKKCKSKYRLAFLDEEGEGPFYEWYNVLSKSEPLMLRTLNDDNLMCFEEVQTGLMRSSVWFQYGFGTHQGPTNNSAVTRTLINQFTKFMLQHLNIRPQNHQQSTSAILFKREINRKIVNYEFVIDCMQKSFSKIFPNLPKLEVVVLDLSVNDSKTVISVISQTKLVVGMHGAEMILTIFLPAGSVVLELFPYGIVPSHVSPLKSLVKITSNIIYQSWENLDERSSHPHPEAPVLQGGIGHLSVSEQSTIKSVLPIPAVQCCHDAAYLYRMFQDTTVGDDFIPLLQDTLIKQTIWAVQAFESERLMKDRWWLPGPISNISCHVDGTSIAITWTPPLNVDGLNIEYAVTISTNENVLEYTSTKARLDPISLQSLSSPLNIWIKCIALDYDSESIDTHAICLL